MPGSHPAALTLTLSRRERGPETAAVRRRPSIWNTLFVDGGSTDDTLEVLRSYGDRLRWISQRDEGQADALNKGLALATGEIIGWLNSDDTYEPGCLEAVAGVFAAEPATQWLYGKVRVIDEDGREIRRWITWYKNRRLRRFSFARLLTENWISQMGVFWRRSAGEAVGPFRKELHHVMDYDYWLRLGARWPGRYVDRYLGAFRWYPTSKTAAASWRDARGVGRGQGSRGRYPLRCLSPSEPAKIVGVYWLLGLLGSMKSGRARGDSA